MPQQLRQGDVFLEKVTKVPKKNLKPVERDKGRVILAYGEVTGHAHAITSGGTCLFEDLKENSSTDRYLQVDEEETTLNHEEHDTLKLYRGWYKVTIQREYSPEEIRNVLD